MRIFKKKKEIRKHIEGLNKNLVTSFVPTLGGIHEGHLSLIRHAKKKSDIVIVSIFLNPIQFQDKNDYKNYPASLKDDVAKLKSEKVDILFLPTVKEMYGSSFEKNLEKMINSKTRGKNNENEVSVSNENEGVKVLPDRNFLKKVNALEKEEHFIGVLTVVSKLFNIIKPKIAVFGEKDFIQLILIRMMVKCLDFDTKILSLKTIREKSGLALSSRNKRLSSNGIKRAERINQIIKKTVANSKNNASGLDLRIKKEFKKIGIEKINRLVFIDDKTLEVLDGKKNLSVEKNRIVVLVSVMIEGVIITDAVKI